MPELIHEALPSAHASIDLDAIVSLRAFPDACAQAITPVHLTPLTEQPLWTRMTGAACGDVVVAEVGHSPMHFKLGCTDALSGASYFTRAFRRRFGETKAVRWASQLDVDAAQPVHGGVAHG